MSLAQQNDLFGIVAPKELEKETRVPSPMETVWRAESEALQQLRQERPALARMAEKVITDPGADISPEDSECWLWVLSEAEKKNKELYAALFYIRGGGARLVEHQQYGFAIHPIIDPSGKGGWSSREEYDRERKCLVPYRLQVVELLKEVRKIAV